MFPLSRVSESAAELPRTDESSTAGFDRVVVDLIEIYDDSAFEIRFLPKRHVHKTKALKFMVLASPGYGLARLAQATQAFCEFRRIGAEAPHASQVP